MTYPDDETARRHTVLIVDDTPTNLSLMSSLLHPHYNVKVAASGLRALKIAGDFPQPDLIYLDVMMPEMDGYEVCRRLKAEPATRDIPVIFLTAKSSVEDEQMGLALGAADYIAKPISPPIVMARTRTNIALKMASDVLKDKNVYLQSEVERRTNEIQYIQDVTILTMASLAETRDNETGNHILRTQHYVKVLAEHLKAHPRFSHYLSDSMIGWLYKSAPLHDIGKVGIPDHILRKPGRLDPEEFEIMKTHATLGMQAIQSAETRLGMNVPFLQCAKEIAYSHQEKWDGSGYPQGLAGDSIPVSARLMALADVYDALISKRVYKDAMSHEAAAAIIEQGKSSHFDPDVVDAFVDIQMQFKTIAGRYHE